MSNKSKGASFGALFSVASVWFGSHAGGGFATGNQTTQYYVQYGWFAPIMALLAMAILACVIRECILMYRNHNFTNYKEMFEEMWAPYTKLELIYEVYMILIVFVAVAVSISGAATLFTEFGLPYGVSIIVIGIILFLLTIFGAKLVAKASTLMSIVILICSFSIFIIGIVNKADVISTTFATKQIEGVTNNFPMALWKVIVYTGYQSVCIPALCSCTGVLKERKDAGKAMFLAFLMNGIALSLSSVMLIGWYKDFMGAGQLALPTLYACKEMGIPVLYYAYSISLCLCFISTGVTSVYGLIPRFSNFKFLSGMSQIKKSALLSAIAIIISMLLALTGLVNLVKYGYAYCGYIGLVAVVIPMLTIGHIKNKRFAEKNPDWSVEE
ncbi:MAG: hypothetical protein PUD43_03565 [Clostridia bacterium]|nr:hypothetical protein [Clostridia bacterium]